MRSPKTIPAFQLDLGYSGAVMPILDYNDF